MVDEKQLPLFNLFFLTGKTKTNTVLDTMFSFVLVFGRVTMQT